LSVHQHKGSGRSFDIAPVLDRGWGYDPYVRHLIGSIRAGRPAPPCLFDANSLYLGSGQDSNRQLVAAKAREITAEELAEYRADQEKRRLAMESLYAEQRAERQRVEREYRERAEKELRAHQRRTKEWAAAAPALKPPRRSAGMVIPTAGWWREDGDNVVVAVMLQAHNATDVLVGNEGAALWMSKGQIKLVKNYLNGLHELTLDAAFAKRAGFCNGEPTHWVS
jgi:glycine/D-amino acid oxidase-like deaminating enzyme